MPDNDMEAFEYVVSNSETALEIDYLTYAMFAYKKRMWLEHFKRHNNDQMPTQAQIDGWISQLSDYDFLQMRNEAAGFFDDSAKEYLREYTAERERTAVNDSILRQVKSYANPWKDILITIICAIVAPLILGTALFIFSIFDKTFQIHVSVGSTQPPASSAPQERPSQ
jgi:hypothetical protein